MCTGACSNPACASPAVRSTSWYPNSNSGPIIAQAAVPVFSDDTEDKIGQRTLAAEHKLYPMTLRLLAEGRVCLNDGQPEFSDIPVAKGTLFNPAV